MYSYLYYFVDLPFSYSASYLIYVVNLILYIGARFVQHAGPLWGLKLNKRKGKGGAHCAGQHSRVIGVLIVQLNSSLVSEDTKLPLGSILVTLPTLGTHLCILWLQESPWPPCWPHGDTLINHHHGI